MGTFKEQLALIREDGFELEDLKVYNHISMSTCSPWVFKNETRYGCKYCLSSGKPVEDVYFDLEFALDNFCDCLWAGRAIEVRGMSPSSVTLYEREVRETVNLYARFKKVKEIEGDGFAKNYALIKILLEQIEATRKHKKWFNRFDAELSQTLQRARGASKWPLQEIVEFYVREQNQPKRDKITTEVCLLGKGTPGIDKVMKEVLSQLFSGLDELEKAQVVNETSKQKWFLCDVTDIYQRMPVEATIFALEGPKDRYGDPIDIIVAPAIVFAEQKANANLDDKDLIEIPSTGLTKEQEEIISALYQYNQHDNPYSDLRKVFEASKNM